MDECGGVKLPALSTPTGLTQVDHLVPKSGTLPVTIGSAGTRVQVLLIVVPGLMIV